jgi:hypothetical protein
VEVNRRKVFIMEKSIYNVLKSIGCPMSLHGAEYITEIIVAIDYYKSVKKEVPTLCALYDMVAENYNKSRESIERCIRSAIKKTFDNISIKKIDEIFGPIDYPTNKQFIYCIYNYIKFSEEEND